MPFNFPNNPTIDQTSTQNGRIYVWNGKVWNLAPDFSSSSVNVVKVLVVGGGGGGSPGRSDGLLAGGGGGAGGFIDTTILIQLNTSYDVNIGAGGASNNGGTNTIGSFSQFGSIHAIGGGPGQQTFGGSLPFKGASGGGMVGTIANLPMISVQGNAGGTRTGSNGSGGGGGAGGAGGNGTASTAGSGGIGKASAVPLNTTSYAGGGGGGGTSSISAGVGTDGGGSGGATSGSAGNPGGANTGGGGGGGFSSATSPAGGSGGSGIVIIKMSQQITPTLSAGLVSTSVNSGLDRIVTITGGTGNITFN